jgi:hypothetical protein
MVDGTMDYILLTEQLKNWMEQSPSSEANSYSATQDIPHILLNSKVHYLVHNNSPLVPILSQINPVHNFLPSSSKIHPMSQNAGCLWWGAVRLHSTLKLEDHPLSAVHNSLLNTQYIPLQINNLLPLEIK